ncbi:hypothetical protein BGV72_31550 [Burkholderia ubonensis]|uniref:hypothetical protein n=1 Tax=Burkholderia ubonensis TaxID=101571 RepID=UPI0008FE3677|nr:hypothetical protein [Burkholderia ubonensis]OJA71089.1 hypothetical protein BGV72_31550 [Burkholderia ubonensis]
MTSKLTDEQIIERCKAAGIKWIPPELPDDCDYEMGFPGSFDMVSMDEMRALLAPTQQPSGDPSLKNPMVRFPTEEDIREWEEAKAERLDADGWLQSGGLLYRLTDERRPQNRDEINVTMANGSRDDAPRAARASEILALITGARQPSGEVTDEAITWDRVVSIGRKHGMRWTEEAGWSFASDDPLHEFANDVARFYAARAQGGEQK